MIQCTFQEMFIIGQENTAFCLEMHYYGCDVISGIWGCICLFIYLDVHKKYFISSPEP